MQGLKEMLEKEERRLSDIVRKTKEQLKDVPEGSLRLSKCQNSTQFYHKTAETSKNGNYISKKDMDLIAQLAQKTYDEKVLKLAERRLAQIKRITKQYQDDEIEQLYWSEHPTRQKLIKPVEPTWKQVLEKWKAQEYERKGFSEDMPLILTEKGMRVRSKSEKMMADYLDRHEIPYKYECPIYLKGVGIRHPDFTYFPEKKRYEIYHEHFGKMDDPIYANQAIQRIKDYQDNGIYLGERLIATFETCQKVLNTYEFEKMLKKYVL